MEKKEVWICSNCGKKYGNKPVGIATWHEDVCDICGKKTMVTEPRDFGGLKQLEKTTRRRHIRKNVSYGKETPTKGEKEETVDIYNPVTDTTYRIREKQGVAKDKLEDTEDLRQELFTFFLWFRWNGEKYMNKSIEKMIKVYLEERELGDVFGKIERQNKLKKGGRNEGINKR